MSLLAKALARRQPQPAPAAIEGGFIADTRLWWRRAFTLLALLALALASWLSLSALEPVLTAPKAITPKAAPAPSNDSTAPMVRVREPAISQDPFFINAQKPASAPVLKDDAAPASGGIKADHIFYTGHFYASDPAERWVKFNGRKLHQGESYEQIDVLEIGPDSAKVRFDGKIIWLNALTNWPLDNSAQGPANTKTAD